MRKRASVAAVALLCACGPSPLDTALAGTWSVTSFVAIAGGNMVAYGQGELVIAVSGRTADVTNICPDYSGAMSATGSGDSAAWSGTLNCPATVITGCTSFTITNVSGTARLLGSVLNVIAAGTGTGCGVTDQVYTAFTSSNQ
jgi:hypothetical protein